MLRCCSLDSDRALRLSTLLLPESSSSTLSYLFRFFYDVTRQSSENKMDVRNLAIVLAPSFFPIPPAKKGSSLESTKNILNLKTQILERLIINANQICMVDGPLAEEYSSNILKMAPNFSSQSEDNSEYPPGPSERRSRKKKKKKHRRSGSLSRVITAFKGIISRSTTPSAASSSNSRRRNSGLPRIPSFRRIILEAVQSSERRRKKKRYAKDHVLN
ncbi:Uncharacterized protein FKW44_022910 [Caligus rogercresseyi]|uniref:Rho-GAP domain-containing protein n=1 Tax=Caligus rogercresseyi TaxID=217165 RepID=A0A7T8JUY7_CALRO|nr:Uncharacterized protein FKW44_022910 [Caligus rogercresseyi]